MLAGKTVAVVVPAYQEEDLVAVTLKGIPAFVDRIIVVDDCSSDRTSAVVEELARDDRRVELIRHGSNRGVGAAIATGYARARDLRIDVTAVMAADNQMPPEELESLCRPVAEGDLDYAKANRLVSGEAFRLIPAVRYFGNAALSLLTKIASGYWHVADSQTGYTAISLEMLDCLDLERLYPRYGFPNHLLVHLNVWNARVDDFPARPVYGVGEKSGIRLRKVVPRIGWLLLKSFFWRLKERYLIRDFHPLIFFYLLGLPLLMLGFLLGCYLSWERIVDGNHVTAASAVLVALLLVMGSQFTLFAMWFDMEANRELRAPEEVRRRAWKRRR
jgi:glycosyltransferase involved in cell wall biosynthesis